MRYIPFRQKALLPEPPGRKIRGEAPILQAAMIRRSRFCLSIYAMKSRISILTPDRTGNRSMTAICIRPMTGMQALKWM